MRVFKHSQGQPHIEPVFQPPTLEDEMQQTLRSTEAAREYAPPGHPDRISATSRIMCEAIEKVFADTAVGIDERVAELKSRVAEIDEGVTAFKKAMRVAADGLVERIQEVMAHYEDITAKLQESPFTGDMPKFLQNSENLKDDAPELLGRA